MRTAGAWRGAAAVALASLIAAAGAVTHAQTMPKEACDAAESERAKLLAGGVQETVKKGPAWAKANLAPHKIKEVERYIALQEDLLFKCGQAKLRNLPAGDVEDGADAPAAVKDASAAGASEKAAVPKRKPPARKSAIAKVDASPASAEPSAAAKVAAKPRPKPKPKADDAFRPPKPIPQPAVD